MQVSVKLFATLAGHRPGVTPGVPFTAEVPAGTTLAGLMRHLRLPPAEVKLAFVNGRLETANYTLRNNDDVGIFPPVGGG